MVSTRQMAITTTGPSSNDDGFQPTQSRHQSSTNGQQQQQAAAPPGTSIVAVSRRPDDGVCTDFAAASLAGPLSVVVTSFRPASQVVVQVAAAVDSSHINLQDLPIELLDKIFSYVGFKKVAQVRVVSR